MYICSCSTVHSIDLSADCVCTSNDSVYPSKVLINDRNVSRL